ncbi:hypothetical protein [Streptomyces sp. NPDC085932]|uniref:hypothetical protein n=1 Tax=Streptomyces sp. NPDC085932 TaxID=3365741 RepID=UPI0037D3FDCF
MAAVLIATLLSGCAGDGGGDSKEERTDRALKGILKEYEVRFEQRREALVTAASHLPQDSPGKDSCDRELNPRPKFQHFNPKSLVLDSYNNPDQGGNVDIVAASEADTPERITDDPGLKLGRFAVAPGWLIRSLWITGPHGPLGTNHFEVTDRYGYEPYKGAEKDPAMRLRKILDVGMHKRYAALFRVTTYREPSGPGDESALVKADVFLADLEKGDVPCRLTASGEPLFVKGYWSSTTPYEDMQTSFQLDISSKLRDMTRS